MLQLLLQVENPGIVAAIVGGILTVGVSIFVLLASLVIIFIVLQCTPNVGWMVIDEKEVVILERFGKFSEIKGAGFNMWLPLIYKPKVYKYRYWASVNNRQVLKKAAVKRISTVAEVVDFPAQSVISKDNGAMFIDAVLNYSIVDPKKMIYSCQNVPFILSKLLQAQLRNVAGALDIDQIIEESATLNVLTGIMDADARRWGIKVQDVKVQHVDAPQLEKVLAKKKNAALENKKVVINAKAAKQKQVIESEGRRDASIKAAEGEAQQVLSRARGQAEAITNAARAEARSIREVGRALVEGSGEGENPAEFLMNLKYIDTLSAILSTEKAGGSHTKITLVPHDTAPVQVAQAIGLNTVAL